MKQVSDISDIVDVDPDALVKIFLLEVRLSGLLASYNSRWTS
jgi:hypothetical protein